MTTLEVTKSKQNLPKKSEKKSKESDETVQDEILLPLDSEEQKMSFVESNLGIKSNLENLVLLEFDLVENSVNKESMKHFIEINNDYVEKEIFFSLNVNFY